MRDEGCRVEVRGMRDEGCNLRSCRKVQPDTWPQHFHLRAAFTLISVTGWQKEETHSCYYLIHVSSCGLPTVFAWPELCHLHHGPGTLLCDSFHLSLEQLALASCNYNWCLSKNIACYVLCSFLTPHDRVSYCKSQCSKCGKIAAVKLISFVFTQVWVLGVNQNLAS